MDWDKLRVFHAVAEAGSFTHAGDTLNLSQSAVSRQISALEENLQVSLFHRHARGLILTEQGESLNRTVRDVFAKLAMTEALLTESKERPTGRLKVTTTVGFGSQWLASRVGKFLATYPDITMTLLLDDSDLDLAMREADVAIRMHTPEAAGSGAAPPHDDSLEHHRFGRLPHRARHAAARRGPRRPCFNPVRRLPPPGDRHQLARPCRAPSRTASPGRAGGELHARHGRPPCGRVSASRRCRTG